MSSARLLPLLLLVCFQSRAHCQNGPSEAPPPKSCPVTKPANPPFVPLSPYPARPSPDQFWFGTDKLWTHLPVSGTWRLANHPPGDATFGQKLAFWRYGYNAYTEPRPNLTVRGKRIDRHATPLLTDGKGNGSWESNDQFFIMTGINFPTAGCWEITGRYDDDELTFVIWIAP